MEMPPPFPPHSKADWLAKVAQDLKGKPLDSLDFTLAGSSFSPFHHPEDQATPPTPVPGMPTGHRLLGAYIDARADVERANQLALDALNKGADLLLFQVSSIELLSKKARRRLLEGVLTDLVSITFTEALFDFPAAPQMFMNLEGEYQHDGLAGDYGILLQNANESIVEDQQFATTFHVSSKENYLETVATLRALRLCWWRITEAYEKPSNCRIVAHVRHAEGTDANDNKISAATQAMSALAGGADGLVVYPSDGAAGTTLPRRVALNLQHILEYEARMTDVPDPAAGSYFLENLTDHLANTMWADFQTALQNPKL